MARAASRRRRRPSSSPPGRRASSQLSPPQPRWLLPPAVRRARETPRTRSEATIRSSAQPFPTAPKLSSTPGAVKRTVRPMSSSATLSMPERARAAAISSSPGSRGRRSRNPQQRDRAVLAGSKAPPVAEESSRHSESRVKRPGLSRAGPVTASRFTRDTSLVSRNHGERVLDRVHLVEGGAGGVQVTGVPGVEGDLEAAGHGRPVDLDPVAGLRGLGQQPAEEGAAGDPPGLVAHVAVLSPITIVGGRDGATSPTSRPASQAATASRSGATSTPA